MKNILGNVQISLNLNETVEVVEMEFKLNKTHLSAGMRASIPHQCSYAHKPNYTTFCVTHFCVTFV